MEVTKKITKKAKKAMEDRVTAAFGRTCDRIQINIMDTVRVMKVGLASVEAGDDDTVLGQKLRAFVDTIRVA